MAIGFAQEGVIEWTPRGSVGRKKLAAAKSRVEIAPLSVHQE